MLAFSQTFYKNIVRNTQPCIKPPYILYLTQLLKANNLLIVLSNNVFVIILTRKLLI